MEFIKGNLKKILFQGDNGYLVGLFKIKEADNENLDLINQTITFTGYFHEFNDMDTYILYGKFVFHPKYGEQFQTENYERCNKEDKESIIEFLTSGLFKGIGEKKAKKIVDVLGNDTLKIILENPDNLLLVPTITKKQIDMLHNTLLEYESSYQIILYLTELGFSTKESMMIYNKYKSKTMDIITNNLYQLVYDVQDLTFKKVDMIFLKKENNLTDSRRIEAVIIYVMNEMCNIWGHTYLLIEDIYINSIKVLTTRIEKEEFINHLNNLILSSKVIKEEEKYYLFEMYDAEDYITNRIKYLVNKADIKYKKLDEKIFAIENSNNIKYNDEQLDAIKSSISKHFLVITGGPGTGKTTIIKTIVDLYQEINKLSYSGLKEEISLLAPTGRASKRMSESTSIQASTIHRFLKWNKENNKFAVNEYNKSDTKLVIIDEASMVDVNLFFSLLKGIKKDARIILVGDYFQLPSVGPGQVLKDIIESDVVPVVKLNYLYRQKEGSNIINLAYDINNGNINEEMFESKNDLDFSDIDSSLVLDKIKQICVHHKKNSYKDFQVLVPMYKTVNGIDNLNKSIQEIFNPKSHKKNEYVLGDVIYREGDKILQLTNMPDENIFNGDIGIINCIDKKEIVIDFDGNLVRFTPSNFNKFKHGYAISIHKSQGSEFKNVVIPVVNGYGKMLYRKLYYTAVTRAKKKLYIVGELNALKKASLNNNSDIRRTTIKARLMSKLAKEE
ncbi:MAG: ATP-dependent RecD-like DNA helicase [Bacilli bacterium]|nr:ATP-dependent RecD-like DNA helicase [Bacilli bacterium]